MAWEDKKVGILTLGYNPFNKPYKRGLFAGRLQHVTKGHQRNINLGLHICDKLLIYVGSAQESGTLRNPFSADLRISLIEDIYRPYIQSGQLVIAKLPDMTHENDVSPLWGKYVLEHTVDDLGAHPDVMIYGRDENRDKWFDPEDIADMSDIRIARDTNGISATKIRKAITDRDIEYWNTYTDPAIHHRFEEVYEELMKCPAYRKSV